MRLLSTIAIILLAVSCGGKPEGVDFGDSDFGELVDRLDHRKQTTLQLQTEWSRVKGKSVQWTVKVVDVRPRRGYVEIFAVNGDRAAYRGYNIVAKVYGDDKAAKLKKGRRVTLRGTLAHRKGKGDNPVVLLLENGQIR